MINIQSNTGGKFENQDFFGTAQTPYGELIVVCDGMGGCSNGRYAAEISVNKVIDEMMHGFDKSPVNAMKSAIEKANAAVWKESKSNPSVFCMGTTLVALLVTPRNAICCHVGDSRLYQLRNGKILHRTFDHSYVFELVKAGLLTEEQARISIQSNIITRAIGLRPRVEIEITDNLAYQKGDRFLLCTDGIWGLVPEKELVAMASLDSDVETVVAQLVEKIDSIGLKGGGMHDNLTAAMIEMEGDSVFA